MEQSRGCVYKPPVRTEQIHNIKNSSNVWKCDFCGPKTLILYVGSRKSRSHEKHDVLHVAAKLHR